MRGVLLDLYFTKGVDKVWRHLRVYIAQENSIKSDRQETQRIDKVEVRLDGIHAKR